MDHPKKVIRHRGDRSPHVHFLAERHGICPHVREMPEKPTMKSNPHDAGHETRGTNKPAADPPLGAKDHYQREKARRARHTPVDSEAMASARREYEALLETSAQKGRGGRPKKKPPKDESSSP